MPKSHPDGGTSEELADSDLLFAESAFAEVDANNIPTLNDIVSINGKQVQRQFDREHMPETLEDIDSRVEQVVSETHEPADIPVLTEIADFPLISDAPAADVRIPTLTETTSDPVTEALEAKVEEQISAMREELDYAARKIIAELVEKHADSIRHELQSRLLAMRDSVMIDIQKRQR
jgi:hypothetical protein